MVELHRVAKSFGANTALHALTARMEAGTTTVVIGPSGSGKSTLLRLVIGLTRPDSGSVRFKGTEVRPETVKALRAEMGYVVQQGGLFPHLTARQNVTLMARYHGWDDGRLRRRLEELSTLTRLPVELLDRFPLQLSGGQRQRVSLMRALLLDPELLLLDEPLGALDPMIRAELQRELLEIFRSLRKTVVLVTHDIGEAIFFADRIILLHEGRLVQAGTPRDLLDAPAQPFVTEFINAQLFSIRELERRSP